jgi:hypothetical protein
MANNSFICFEIYLQEMERAKKFTNQSSRSPCSD